MLLEKSTNKNKIKNNLDTHKVKIERVERLGGDGEILFLLFWRILKVPILIEWTIGFNFIPIRSQKPFKCVLRPYNLLVYY